jgi:hypothetical protein
MVTWLSVSGFVLRQNIMVEGCGGRKLLTSWLPASREPEEARVKIYLSKVHPWCPTSSNLVHLEQPIHL